MNAMDDAPRCPIGAEIGGPGRAYFDSVVTDNLLDAFLELAAEVWTLKDRQHQLERALAELGIDAVRLVETRTPSANEAAERKRLREAFVARLFESFLRRPDGGVR
jgi:hypothetical protein